MARGRISKTLYCKRAVFLDSKEKPQLQAKLSDALSKLKKAKDRKEASGEDSKYVRVIFYYREYAEMLFGILASYECGISLLTVVDEDDAEMLALEQVAPPKSKHDKRQEFLEGVCHFAVYKNHFVVATSRSLRVKQVEQHINWLLDTAKTPSADANRVALSDHVNQAIEEKITKTHVRQTEIGTSLRTFTPQESESLCEDKGWGNRIWTLFDQQENTTNSLLKAIDGNVELTLKVTYKPTRRKSPKGHEVMDDIALKFRNLEEDDIVITLADGSRIKGRDLRVTTSISVEGRDGIPNHDSLFEEMRKWLVKQLRNEMIEP